MPHLKIKKKKPSSFCRTSRHRQGEFWCRSGILRSVQSWFLTVVSGETIGPIFKGSRNKRNPTLDFLQNGTDGLVLDFLTRENGNDRLSRNVGKQLPLYAA